MDREKLRSESAKLLMAKSLDDTKDLLDIYIDFLFEVIVLHTEPGKNQLEQDAKIIPQMVFNKMLNLSSLLEGLNYKGRSGQIKNFIDPTIVASGVRNIVELISTFHLIYRSENTDEERDIIYKMWVVAGLKYRQRFVGPSSIKENIEKAAFEAAEIAELIQEIKKTETFTNLAKSGQKTISAVIDKKDYRLKFYKGDTSKLHWQEIIEFMGFKPELTGKLYTYLSLYAHPSNVSVFQYKELFQGEDDHVKMAIFNIKNLLAVVSKFIGDYIKLFPSAMGIFDSLPTLNQVVINWQLKFTTVDAEIINNAMDELND